MMGYFMIVAHFEKQTQWESFSFIILKALQRLFYQFQFILSRSIEINELFPSMLRFVRQIMDCFN